MAMDYNGGINLRDETHRRRRQGNWVYCAAVNLKKKLVCFYLFCLFKSDEDDLMLWKANNKVSLFKLGQCPQ